MYPLAAIGGRATMSAGGKKNTGQQLIKGYPKRRRENETSGGKSLREGEHDAA